ncbi:glycosyltransferase family 2 protein [Actinomycetospora sp. OC33-EN06]|uniref:Glycosyltransferase family 2 protein n=1 Tax=Actinomycetospora aeridis TaxID=3129231 RepID=A0ABU8NGG8_9PSEU
MVRVPWATPRRPRVSVVIPTLDEEANIGWVLGRIDASVEEVIVVDGRSRDATVDVARRSRPQVRILEQPLPGKGAALALGLCAASGDIVVMMDADGSMDPREIPAFVQSLLGGADLVKGSRTVRGGGSHDISALRRCGNRVLIGLTNGTYRQRWSELCYGYAALWTDIVPVLELAALACPAPGPARRLRADYGHGFEIEALIFCRAARAALRIAEVPSFEYRRRSGASHLRPWRDGWRVLQAVTRERTWTSGHAGLPAATDT